MYDFVWDMTENDWKTYMEHCKTNSIVVTDDMYGQLWCGDVCFEFMIYDNDISYCTSYLYGEEGGYADTSDGVPYNEKDNDVEVPLDCKTFNEFKENIEVQIINMANENKDWDIWLSVETHKWH